MFWLIGEMKVLIKICENFLAGVLLSITGKKFKKVSSVLELLDNFGNTSRYVEG